MITEVLSAAMQDVPPTNDSSIVKEYPPFTESQEDSISKGQKSQEIITDKHTA